MTFGAPRRVLIASDTLAIVVFATIGLLSHDHALSARGYARDVLPILGAWLVVAAVLRLYADPRAWRLAATWAIAVPVGVLVRALILGRSLNGKEAAFLIVALVMVALFVVACRVAVSRLFPARP